jgi:hypothetical protein
LQALPTAAIQVKEKLNELHWLRLSDEIGGFCGPRLENGPLSSS